MTKLLLILGLLTSPAFAQQAYSVWQSSANMSFVPGTATTLQPSTAYLTELTLSDPSGVAATVTLTDTNGTVLSFAMGGTNPSILDFPFSQGLPFSGNISWVASVASTVKGHAWGRF
jgi:uncharacterized membrane protein